MNVKALHLPVTSGQPEAVTREEWAEAMAPFSIATRGTAANLAAHRWHVYLLGTDVLVVTSPWTRGYVYRAPDFGRRMTVEEHAALFSAAPEGTSSRDPAYTYCSDRGYVSRFPNEASLGKIEP